MISLRKLVRSTRSHQHATTDTGNIRTVTPEKHHPPRRAWAFLAVACVTGLTSATSFAQPNGPTWVALDTQPPGTRASVVLDRANSNRNQSVFNVTIHGFYTQSVSVSGQGTFQKVWLPSATNSLLPAAGRPALPTISFLLNIPSTAAGATIGAVTFTDAPTLPGYRVYPAQPEAIEEPDNDQILPFNYDAAFYASTAQYPTSNGAVGQVNAYDRLKFQRVTVHPFKILPSAGRMTVLRQFTVRVDHAGAALPYVELTRRTNAAFASMVANWATAPVIVDLATYKGCYLFVCSEQHIDELQPLINQKKQRGLKVTVLTLESLASPTATNIRNAILNWRNGCTLNGGDAYVLLVGDTNLIPMTSDPVYGHAGDHHYGSTDNDLWPEIRLGRLSIDSATDLSNQVSKILTYINNPPANGFIDRVELVAHKQIEKGYIDCMNEVADYAYYIDPPVFTRRLGNASTGTNANVVSDTTAGRGIVMYRGHGNSTQWTNWDFNTADFGSSNLNSISNGSSTPVVLHVACTNAALGTNDSLAELWMEKFPGGAVASYGATSGTGTGRNHAFAKRFFNLLYGGNPPQTSILVDFSWLMAGIDLGTDTTNENWVKYLLLGDPEMTVWKDTPIRPILVGLPTSLYVGQRSISVNMRSVTGAPLAGKIVALYKEGDVLMNAYTNADGVATFNVPINSGGQLSVRGYEDLDGRIGDVQSYITIRCLADVDDGNGTGTPDGGVTIDDLLFYLRIFDRGDIRADIDNGTGTGTPDGGVTIDDLLHFLNRFDLGC